MAHEVIGKEIKLLCLSSSDAHKHRGDEIAQ